MLSSMISKPMDQCNFTRRFDCKVSATFRPLVARWEETDNEGMFAGPLLRAGRTAQSDTRTCTRAKDKHTVRHSGGQANRTRK